MRGWQCLILDIVDLFRHKSKPSALYGKTNSALQHAWPRTFWDFEGTNI